jgi:hypothetical protein
MKAFNNNYLRASLLALKFVVRASCLHLSLLCEHLACTLFPTSWKLIEQFFSYKPGAYRTICPQFPSHFLDQDGQATIFVIRESSPGHKKIPPN